MTDFDHEKFAAAIKRVLDETSIITMITPSILIRACCEIEAQGDFSNTPQAEAISGTVAARLVKRVLNYSEFMQIVADSSGRIDNTQIKHLSEKALREAEIAKLRTVLSECHQVLVRDHQPKARLAVG